MACFPHGQGSAGIHTTSYHPTSSPVKITYLVIFLGVNIYRWKWLSYAPMLHRLHALDKQQTDSMFNFSDNRNNGYKLAVLTYKIRHTSTPAYPSYHIRPRESTHHLRSSTTPLLHRPTTRTHFADRAFRCSAPAIWNSLNADTLCCSSLALFKHSLKTFLFRQTFRPSSSCIARL